MAEAKKVAARGEQLQSNLEFSRVIREGEPEATLGEIIDTTPTTCEGDDSPTPVTEIAIFNKCIPLEIAHEFALWLLEVTEDPITKGVDAK